ncbi:MAG: hypothetical protein JOZ81_31350 [Chloroflexi bacterium]|nr:hypothetical protein [Chloroflexota bacterium]
MKPWGRLATAPRFAVSSQARTHVDLTRVLTGCAAALAAVYLLGFVVASYFRLTYAYPLWVMEAPAVQAVRRVLHGLPLYGPPTLDYVPPVYAPLYFYVSAAAAVVLGPSLLTLRLVSFLAALGSAALVAHLVWRETRAWLPTLVSAALFISSTTLAADSLDLARVDVMCVLLILAGLDAARAADVQVAPRAAIWLSLASGVLLALAVLTKQTAFVVVLAMGVHQVLSRSLRRLLAYVVGSGATLGLAALLLTLQSGNWWVLYLVRLPANHALQLTALDGFWSRQLLPAFTLPLLALPFFLIGSWLRRELAAVRFWLLAALAMVGMAWGASLNRWSADNVVLPALAILAAGFGLGLHEALRRLPDAGSNVGAGRAFRAYALLLVVAQFAFVHYNPRDTSPLRSDVEAGQRLVAAMQGVPGTAFGPDVSELLYQAGKGEQPVGLSVGELQGTFGGRPVDAGRAWGDAYAAALDQRRFDAVLLDPDSVEFFLTDTTRDRGYVDTGPLIPAGDEYYRLGGRYMPQVHVWVPRERAPSAR